MQHVGIFFPGCTPFAVSCFIFLSCLLNVITEKATLIAHNVITLSGK